MKKLFILAILIILIIGGCEKTYNNQLPEDEVDQTGVESVTFDEGYFSNITFEGHTFGESYSEVIEIENKIPENIVEYEGGEKGKTITYIDRESFGYTVNLSFTFSEDKVYIIDIVADDINDSLSIEERYELLKKELVVLYGEPDEEIVYSEDTSDQLVALWTNIKYSIALATRERGFTIVLRHV